MKLRRAAFALCATGGSGLLVAAAALLLWVKSPQDVVQLRNALLYEVAPAGAYDWTPAKVPQDFMLERAPAPHAVEDFALDALRNSADSEFGKALQLAAALVRNRTVDWRGDAEPIQADTQTTLTAISQQGLGYCADYTQVLMGLAHAAGIQVREWGMAFGAYGGEGHAFVEVYDHTLEKWVFLDPFFSFYVTSQTGVPLSAGEFREALLSGHAGETVHLVPIDAAKFGFKSPEHALKYYNRGAPRFYLWWGNNVFSYDANPVVRRLGQSSRTAGQIAAILLHVQPRLVLSQGYVDADAFERLYLTRVVLYVAGACSALLVVGICLVPVARSLGRSQAKKVNDFRAMSRDAD